jgi:hypothetical protein
MFIHLLILIISITNAQINNKIIKLTSNHFYAKSNVNTIIDDKFKNVLNVEYYSEAIINSFITGTKTHFYLRYAINITNYNAKFDVYYFSGGLNKETITNDNTYVYQYGIFIKMHENGVFLPNTKYNKDDIFVYYNTDFINKSIRETITAYNTESISQRLIYYSKAYGMVISAGMKLFMNGQAGSKGYLTYNYNNALYDDIMHSGIYIYYI